METIESFFIDAFNLRHVLKPQLYSLRSLNFSRLLYLVNGWITL